MIFKTYISKNSRYLSWSIENSISKIFDFALNIFSYNPNDFIFIEYEEIKNTTVYAKSREHTWEFANDPDKKQSLTNRMFNKLHKNFVIYFTMDVDDMMKAEICLTNTKQSRNNFRQENTKIIHFQKRNSIIQNLIRFEAIILEINKCLYKKTIKALKKCFKAIKRPTINIISSFSGMPLFSKSFKKDSKNRLFDKEKIGMKFHYY